MSHGGGTEPQCGDVSDSPAEPRMQGVGQAFCCLCLATHQLAARPASLPLPGLKARPMPQEPFGTQTSPPEVVVSQDPAHNGQYQAGLRKQIQKQDLGAAEGDSSPAASGTEAAPEHSSSPHSTLMSTTSWGKRGGAAATFLILNCGNQG